MGIGLLENPDDCFFGKDIPDAVLNQQKALFSEDLMNLGFLCDPKNFSNLDLRQLHTFLWAYLFRKVNDLSSNQQLADCLWDLFFCQMVTDRFACDVATGAGTLTNNGPANGMWKYLSFYYGGQDAVTALGQSWVYEVDDDDQAYGGGTFGNGNVHSLNQSSGSNARGVMVTLFIRQDC